MYCRLQNKVEQESMLVSYMKNNLINNCAILLKFSNTMFIVLLMINILIYKTNCPDPG